MANAIFPEYDIGLAEMMDKMLKNEFSTLAAISNEMLYFQRVFMEKKKEISENKNFHVFI